ncbi:MAG: YtxH domain-containing protein [Bacteroidales bacterium]|jgi:gas vesicle protein|nr:YtxH domain-containing protein [Bacteroidales bacterium]MBO7257027.1 YtxH domain-containing protein [Bacteroidales bacterium]MBO7283744.1 YtxH domain-containing protein [Bacteroidales bacterium]MBQ1279775.1 YtxH domain-containing protein [Bacteroidales bacterium]MBQ5593815.1 YtxH domain-containing protein [Bacteroidales bacterium]
MKCDNFFAFLGGLIVGAGAAILFAPESGAETRKKIKNTFEKEYQNIKEKINNMNNDIEDTPVANDTITEDISE